MLTYAAIIWANATALAIISRYIFGDILCFGFSYQIAGYTVYFGEVLIAVAMLVLCSIICIIGKRLLKWVQIVSALILFFGIITAFIAIVIHNGGISIPDFPQGGSYDKVM